MQYVSAGVCSRSVWPVLLVSTTLAVTTPGAAAEPSQNPFPAQFLDAAIFSTAIADAAKSSIVPRALSGITVPHHLVAADLVARAFRAVDAGQIDKVIILFPDHFEGSRLPFATTRRPFETVFGRVEISQPDVRLLLQSRELVDESNLFGGDHGIGAILPFIKYYLPSTRIVPIAVSRSRRDNWDALETRLRLIAQPRTLVVQSTDFSHYLTLPDAVERDQEVLNILAADYLDAVPRLRQPQHTDSRGSQYLQMRLQREVYGARPIVMYNSNSQAYVDRKLAQTTSYIVQLYEVAQPTKVGADAHGSKVYCFAGDTLFGRGILRALGSGGGRAERVLREMQHVLHGCPLVVNLTGVVVPEMPINLGRLTLAMPAALTLDWLRALNVVAVNLANNHSMDLGPEAFDTTADILTKAGFAMLKHGSVLDLGPFRLAALTDLDNWSRRDTGMISQDDIRRLAGSTARPPLFTMVNWGSDYEAKPGFRQLELMHSLSQAAVSLIIGVHPHLTAANFDLLAGGQALSIYSLGNFLFDQGAQMASGSVLEVRIFDQGTFFARLVPIPNFLENMPKAGASD